MVKKLNGYLLTKKVKHKYLVKVRSCSGAKVTSMSDHFKQAIRDENPDHVVLNAGINILQSEKTWSQIAKSIIELAMSLIKDGNSVIVSGIVPRFDNVNSKANKGNNRLVVMCGDRRTPFLSRSESIVSSKHLNGSKFEF